jgi:hypothetical protein
MRALEDYIGARGAGVSGPHLVFAGMHVSTLDELDQRFRRRWQFAHGRCWQFAHGRRAMAEPALRVGKICVPSRLYESRRDPCDRLGDSYRKEMVIHGTI